MKSARTKYGTNVRGGFTSASFKDYRLPPSIVTALMDASNQSLALSTWSTYKTAENHLRRCEIETGVRMRFPMDDRMVLAFVGWLISVRKVSSVSVSKYLSGLRMAHIKKGGMPPNLRPEMVSLILKGKANEEAMRPSKAPRLAVTVPVMRLLKALITRSNMELGKKRLLWVVSCLAFHGSFRIHELLSREKGRFDPTTTLLGCNVRMVFIDLDGKKEELLDVYLKSPKEDKLRTGVSVELFETGTFSCPVSAFRKWRAVSKLAVCPSKPLFRLPGGECLTGNQFNKELKLLLGKVVNYDEGKFLSHSFRAGMASMMAAAGMSDAAIMRQGRWNSSAFMVYCKTGRASRLREQRDLARSLAKL